MGNLNWISDFELQFKFEFESRYLQTKYLIFQFFIIYNNDNNNNNNNNKKFCLGC